MPLALLSLQRFANRKIKSPSAIKASKRRVRSPSPTSSLESEISFHSRGFTPASPDCVAQLEMEMEMPMSMPLLEVSIPKLQAHQEDSDLSWIMQLPIMEMDPTDQDRVYFVQSF